jgi:hypothetical protein
MTASKTKTMTMTTKSTDYVYCDVHGKELEERTRDGGWEIVEGFVQIHPYFGPGNTYLLRRPRVTPDIVKLQAELKHAQHKLSDDTKKHTEQERRLRGFLIELEKFLASPGLQQPPLKPAVPRTKPQLVAEARAFFFAVSDYARRLRNILGPDPKEPT